MYDKLPISAFVSEPKTPDPDMNLPNLQFWNCMDYGVVSIHKQFIGSMDYELYTRDFGIQKGTYICTIDNYHQDCDMIDYATSENPAEHKSHNLIELNNVIQFALYPNNRMRIFDNSLTPVDPKMPDFKVSTEFYQVENGFERLGMNPVKMNISGKLLRNVIRRKKMGRHPTDLGQDFVKRGMRLITQTSSDALMKNLVTRRKNQKILKKKYKYIRPKCIYRCILLDNRDFLRIFP